MQKRTLLGGFLLMSTIIAAQVGIGISSPASTLDIVAKNTAGAATNVDGVLIPRVDRQRAQNMTGIPTSTLIYVNSIATGTQLGTAVNIDTVGYYYYNGTSWVKLHNPTNSLISTNIYNGDGSLTGNRIVTQGAFGLAFNATVANAFSVDGASFSVDAANHRVGVGTAAPQRPLHVNANTGPVRFENLATLAAGTSGSGLVIDTNGDIYKNNSVSVEGQILRIGLNALTYTTAGEVGVRFSANDSASEMLNAPNGAPNFINTIVGATITDNVSATAGQGSVARTTDQITLQPGVYKLQVRLVGSFSTASASNTLFLKSIVNNNEYSLINAANNSNQTSVYYFDDYINITGTSAQTVDFSIGPGGNSFVTSSNASPGTGNSYRSLILIQRLR